MINVYEISSLRCSTSWIVLARSASEAEKKLLEKEPYFEIKKIELIHKVDIP